MKEAEKLISAAGDNLRLSILDRRLPVSTSCRIYSNSVEFHVKVHSTKPPYYTVYNLNHITNKSVFSLVPRVST